MYDIENFENYEDYINKYRYSISRQDIITPSVVIDVCASLANQINTNRAFVTLFGVGILSYYLRERGYDVVSLISYESEKTIADKYSFAQYTPEDSEKYDLICSDSVVQDIKLVESMLDVVSDVISDKGHFLMTFQTSISYDKKYREVLGYAEEKDLYVNAVIDLPKDSYAPSTHIETKILVFQRVKKQKRFIARISEANDVDVIISNYVNNISAKNYIFGIWVEREEHFDLQSFEAELFYRKAARNYGGKAVTLEDLAIEINRPDKNNTFKNIPNAIYIPKVGVSHVTDSLENLSIKAQNYIQVVLDEKTISTQYACFFLNSDQGVMNRKAIMTGFIPSFNLQTIKKLVIILPDGEGTQSQLLETYNQIEELTLQIEALKSRFFKRPCDYKMIQKSIKDINNVETLSDWVETLPFPLASILRRYIAENSYEKKQETLLLFFEAYAIFNACILLSVIDENLNTLDCESIFESTNLDHFTRSSFGNWVFINKLITNFVLGKHGLKSTESSDESNRILKYFKTENSEVIKILCNRDILKVLSSAKDKRNVWKGHTGISSENICKEHVRELEQYLNQLRAIIKDSYENMDLIRAISCVNTRSGAENTIEKLSGSNALFVKEALVTATPLMTDVLYLKMNDTQRVIELLPLIIFKSSPSTEKNACYFYSRNETDNTLYVSYHYEQQPEESEPGHEALDALTRLIHEKNE